MSKAILIFGATGKQGGAVVRSLLAHPRFSPSEYTILAATRKLDSPSAQRLANLSPAIRLVTGDLSDAAGTFARLPVAPWGVYTMTMPGGREAEQGIAVAEAAAAAGAHHFVFSSVDRGEAEQRNAPTRVPHFQTKHRIEARLRELAAASADGSFSYTILRPPFFLDNLEPGIFGRITATLWRDRVTRAMSVIDTRDIGTYAAAALLQADEPAYRNAELNIAGDRLTFAELDAKFRAKTGAGIPVTYAILPRLLTFLNHDFAEMTTFFEESGFAAKPQEQTLPVTSVEGWLDQSRHVKKAA